MAMSPGQNSESFTVELAGSELPETLAARFPKPPLASTRFSVTVAPVQTEAEKLAALRKDLQEGLDDVATGRVGELDEVFARLKSQFPGT
jgi:predicted transcriptional regulator